MAIAAQIADASDTAGKVPLNAATKALKLKGPEKAAILFLCLGEKRGTELMKKLDEGDIQTITRAMSGLGTIPAEVVEDVMTEFTVEVTDLGGVVGSFSIAENMLKNFLPDTQVADIMKEIRGPKRERGLWERFEALSESVIANYLKSEHAQTAAVILSNVSPEVAARVLPLLETEQMQDIVERMIGLDSVPHHMLREIEETLQQDVVASASQPTATELQQRMADLFNRLDPEAFSRVAPVLEERDPDTFNSIKQKMFTFDDLARLDQQSLAQVMRGVQGNTLPLALRGASKELRDLFLAALPQRSRDMLVEEMATMGPVRGREVREAQAELVDMAKDLAEQDVIRLPTGDDDELIE
ncbi:flagellar motor protein [Oceanicola granulosus HTCC2516]|uniref:Flagellar motor switch protein FliG n=1 Tax=Oceanicola granulosus (strain ATCC BAA-861 / DSM 15982 / KCTC 12143 / HTCC2516) TaxID=314256 RepID=Q2CGH6_OCEGH|nr:flagellar motor switch protein FliG [Oceanicola granulosus]EAR51742.1 flagellar motor protein [Oceanicola granulosus HTCC2516]